MREFTRFLNVLDGSGAVDADNSSVDSVDSGRAVADVVDVADDGVVCDCTGWSNGSAHASMIANAVEEIRRIASFVIAITGPVRFK